jgi:hypothetical protein
MHLDNAGLNLQFIISLHGSNHRVTEILKSPQLLPFVSALFEFQHFERLKVSMLETWKSAKGGVRKLASPETFDILMIF